MSMPAPDPDYDPEVLEELFFAAGALGPDEQPAFLREHCVGRPDLRQALENLLRAHRNSDPAAWELPALQIEARELASEDGLRFDRLGPYRILSAISSGGMGTVYLAERDDEGLCKRVAIKIVHRAFTEIDAELMRRFQQERQILARLEHPNIARMLDAGRTPDGLPYLVMEFVDGLPIDRYAAERRLPVAARLDLFRAVCAAVSYAHGNLIVHRDLKPRNILVAAGGVPKLLDFGIAKLLTATPDEGSTGILTPGYASPEQAAGLPITTASDVYSLGVILYELLVGGRLYPPGSTQTGWAADPVAPSQRLRGADPPDSAPPDARRKVNADLDKVVLKALRKEPGRRYSSVADFAEDIRRVMGGYPVKARAATWPYRARRFVVRRRAAVAGAAIALSAVAVAGAVTLAQYRESARRFVDSRSFVNSLLFELNDAITDLPGSTAARLLLARRARQYLDILASEHSSDPAVERDLALAYRRLGDVLGRPYYANLGDTSGALANYQKAAALLERLSASGHQDVGLISELGLVYGRLGKVMKREQKPEETIRLGERAVALLQRAAVLNPGSREVRLELANAYLNVSMGWVAAMEVNRSTANIAPAETAARQALAIIMPLAAGNPENDSYHFAAARAFQLLAYDYRYASVLGGDTAYQARRVQENLLAHEQIEAAYRLNPAHYRRLLAASWDDLSSTYLETGDTRRAEAAAREHLRGAQAVSDADPSNSEARAEVAWGLCKIGRVLQAQHRPQEAVAYTSRAAAVLEEALRRDPSSGDIRGMLIQAHEWSAESLLSSGKRPAALAQYRASIELLGRVPGTSGEIGRALDYELMGDALARAERSQAHAYYEQAAQLWEHLRDTGQLPPQYAGRPAALRAMAAN